MKPYKYLILLPDDGFKIKWDLLITILLLFVFFVTPYRIAFVSTDNIVWTIVDLSIDFMFLIDIILNFFSAYYNQKYILVDKRGPIAWSYIRGWFFIDLIAIVPLNMILSWSDFGSLLRLTKVSKLYKLVKMFRLVRMLKIIKERNKIVKYINDFLKVSVAFERLFFFLLVFSLIIHIVSCFWVMVAKLEDN